MLKQKSYPILLSLLISSILIGAPTSQDAKIYYISFTVETGGAITPDFISSGDERSNLSEKDLSSLIAEFSKAERVTHFQINLQRIRLKAIINGITYIVDSEGNCVTSKLEMMKMNIPALELILRKYYKLY